jgi:hypothetical protein
MNKGLLFLLILFSAIFAVNFANASIPDCHESWVCDDWSSCYHGETERVCWDENHCGTLNNMPEKRRSCSYCSSCDSNDYSRSCSISDRYYYDNYEAELMNYYQDKYQATQPQIQNPQQPIQVINVQYPEDNRKMNDNGREWDINGWMIGVILLGLLVLIALILIVVVALRR